MVYRSGGFGNVLRELINSFEAIKNRFVQLTFRPFNCASSMESSQNFHLLKLFSVSWGMLETSGFLCSKVIRNITFSLFEA